MNSSFGSPEKHCASNAEGLLQNCDALSELGSHFEDMRARGVREAVERAVKQSNQLIREKLRSETRLSLTSSEERSTAPVTVEDGYPLRFKKLLESIPPLVWTLRQSIGLLRSGSESIALVGRQFEQIVEQFPQLRWHDAQKHEFESSFAALLRLIEEIEQVKLQKLFAEIDEDILGAYFFLRGEVKLYWIPIGLIAGALNVAVEDLTVVVLAHELAHAYTHLGRDIDGHQWATNHFGDSDLGVIEGLAQFYTETVTDRLSNRFPNAHSAYEALLAIQAGPYKTHLEWTEQTGSRASEILRWCLLEARAKGKAKCAEFETLVKGANERLKRSK